MYACMCEILCWYGCMCMCVSTSHVSMHFKCVGLLCDIIVVFLYIVESRMCVSVSVCVCVCVCVCVLFT